MSMQAPTVHLNGTSGRDLAGQVERAGAALQAALRAMADASPNGRDYYTQGEAALPLATAEHQARMDRVAAVMAEYAEIWETIHDQIPE